MKLRPHPVANLFPLMSESQIHELAADIDRNGLLNPIVVQGATLLDGRNRLRACALANVAPLTVEWQGEGDPSLWIVSMNLHRRHLSPAQVALLGSKLKEHLAKEVLLEKSKENQSPSAAANWRQRASRSESARLAAQATGASTRSIERATRVREQGSPALVEAVREGKLSLHLAERVLDRPKREQVNAARKLQARRESHVAHQRYRERWGEVLQGFELSYGAGRDTNEEELEFLRPLRDSLDRVRVLLACVLDQWAARARMELVSSAPHGRRAVKNMDLAVADIDALIQEVAA